MPNVERDSRPGIALVPWGDVFEDYLDPIGLTLHDFALGMTGGWMFGYANALALAGVRTVIVLHSSRVNLPTRLVHAASGTPIIALPSPSAYRFVRRRFSDAYSWSHARAGRSRSGVLLPLDAMAFAALGYLATSPAAIARVVRDEECSAILCQEYEDPRFENCLRAGVRAGVPVFAVFQGANWQRSPLDRLVRRRSMATCAGLVIGASEEIERVRAEYGVPPARIAHIFNPVDVATWYPDRQPSTRASLGLPLTAPLVVWHGRIDVRTKGIDVLLDAWTLLRQTRVGRDAWLLMVGNGRDSQWLREQGMATAGHNVLWLDEYMLDRGRMRSALSAADVYAFSSRHEGFPVAPLEAMACGLPVVACEVEGIRDALPAEATCGIVVPKEDHRALAAALGSLLEDGRARAMMGENARHRIETSFAPETVGRQLRAFLLPKGPV